MTLMKLRESASLFGSTALILEDYPLHPTFALHAQLLGHTRMKLSRPEGDLEAGNNPSLAVTETSIKRVCRLGTAPHSLLSSWRRASSRMKTSLTQAIGGA
jgi:hypothetical protein